MTSRRLLHGGIAVHVSHDDYGPVEVVDEAGIRALYFGTPHRQSAMAIADPYRLELAYTRSMLAALLFLSGPPNRALLVGLGGGSLAKFLWHHFPDCRIDAVERRMAVARVAGGWFGLPEEARLRVWISDGADYVEEAVRREENYDLILLDAYDGLGMDSTMLNQAFLDRCAALLAPGGAWAANLWGSSPPLLEYALERLGEAYGGPVVRLPVPQRGNVIGLGRASPAARPDWRDLKIQAENLETRLGVEFPVLVRQLRRANSSWMERLRGR